MFKLLTNKSVSSLRTYCPRLFNTLLKNNNKEQYFRANNVSHRLSSTVNHQFCNKIPFTPYLPYRNKLQSPFHPFSFSSTRSLSSFPPSRFHSAPQRTLKQIVAFGGAALTFFIIEPTLFYIINGAIAYGAYKLFKRLLDRIFPTSDIRRNQFYSYAPTAKLTKTQSKFYSKSIEQIKKANLNYNIIGFTGPHTISTESVKSVGLGSTTDSRGQQQHTLINIEYWAIGEMNNKEALIKVEGILHNHDDIEIKNIVMYWPNTGQVVNVPIYDWRGYKKPPIIEAEFRDID